MCRGKKFPRNKNEEETSWNGSTTPDKNIFQEKYLPRELEEYTATHEKLARLYAEASERNREELERWIDSIEYAKEHKGYVENIKLLRGVKRYYGSV